MMPEHCKEVNLYEVDFPLTIREITRALAGKKVYRKTEYIVLSNRNEMAVVRLKKKFSEDLFWPVRKIEIVSLPENTVFVEDRQIDVMNKFMMTTVARQYEGKVVVVKGRFEHISFARYEGAVKLNVVDVAPPYPAKLPFLVEECLRFGFIDDPVEINSVVVDLNDMVKNVKTGGVMYPCHASSLKWPGKTYFLDRVPELVPEETNDITLVGCDLSLKIFKELYHLTPPFINICPKKLLKEQNVEGPTIIKCCDIAECELSGDIAMVPWGARMMDVEEALEYLLE